MFPMTKQIKCLVPDFGVTGTLLNAALGTVGTLVRLVSCTPCKFCLPAKLSFDKDNCTVCVEIKTDYIMNYCCDAVGYEHRFSCCEDFRTGRRSKCHCEVAQLKETLAVIQTAFGEADISPDAKKSRALWMTLGNKVFQLLARSKKIDVKGVNKCSENVLFSFQVCYFPYRGFCVDVSGCKPVKTIPAPDSTDDVEVIDDETDSNIFLPATSSYRVQADCEFSYEFLKLCNEDVDVCPSTTTTSSSS
jgi:hypothetical protein